MSRAAAEAVRRLTGVEVRAVRRGGGGLMVELADGRQAVVKSGDVAAEVAGLRWLAEPATLPVPSILGHDRHWLALEYLPPGRPGAAAAVRFGQGLARLHATGAPAFGAAPPGGPAEAWIGRAPMRNTTGDDWPSWYAEHRVRPYLRTARDQGALDGEDTAVIEAACAVLPEVAGPAVSPARLHGDLWSGNVCWSVGPAGPAGKAGDGDPVHGWLIDPAAHGGHPETDLAMLALFGCPYRDQVLTGYQQVTPLADGWRQRIGLHQLFPLLVHVVLFGGGYAGQAVAAARSALAARRRLP